MSVEVASMIFSLTKLARPPNRCPVVSVITIHAMKTRSFPNPAPSILLGPMHLTILPECATLAELHDTLMNKLHHVHKVLSA